MIQVLDEWMPILPQWIVNNILDQLVIPKLVQEVRIWDPVTDTVPIHTWVHPWIPLMGLFYTKNFVKLKIKLIFLF